MKKEQILSLLNMSEVKKYEWLQEHKIIKHVAISKKHRISFESLPDLAARLRDEVRKANIKSWNYAITVIACHINESPSPKYSDVSSTEWQWAQHIILNQNEYSVEICWITAALLAGLENDK